MWKLESGTGFRNPAEAGLNASARYQPALAQQVEDRTRGRLPTIATNTGGTKTCFWARLAILVAVEKNEAW